MVGFSPCVVSAISLAAQAQDHFDHLILPNLYLSYNTSAPLPFNMSCVDGTWELESGGPTFSGEGRSESQFCQGNHKGPDLRAYIMGSSDSVRICKARPGHVTKKLNHSLSTCEV